MAKETTLLTTNYIVDALGVCGWSHLDAVLLASLATEAPLLLIGPHGTAKSLLVERLAITLGLPMRHYNAALLNYDDLVGIPMPDEDGDGLHFITTPGTIWDAGFVFFDEISRCRADLQNKLFPIIHERRVIGLDLNNLKHRWAAMNPPAPDEPDTANTGNTDYYIGSEPLDPALTDRFPYIVRVPSWMELSRDDRLHIVASHGNGQKPEAMLNLSDMVQQCAKLITELKEEFDTWLGDYVVCLMDLLEQSGLPQSPRRAAMWADSILAVHAARIVLGGEDVDSEESAEIAITYGIPQNATDVPPTQVKVIALHKQAWELAECLEDDDWRQVMEEFDPARRVVIADQLEFSDEDMSRLITQTIGTEDSDARQMGLATAMFLAFKSRRNLDPSAYEPLAQLAYHILEPRLLTMDVNNMPFGGNNNPQVAKWNEIKNWIEAQRGREETLMFRLLRNYLLNGIPNLWNKYDWKESLQQFKQDLLLFGIGVEEVS
jgi:MoxR-like ATPase